jgi:hypothetical protein
MHFFSGVSLDLGMFIQTSMRNASIFAKGASFGMRRHLWVRAVANNADAVYE